MRRILLLVLAAILWWALSRVAAQNLVPNPGFDELVDCPYAENQIYLAEPWTSVITDIPPWIPDLFHECGQSTGLGRVKVPNAGQWPYSYQKARSGGGYAGIFVFTTSIYPNSEYLEAPLLEPLKAGTDYYASFYVSVDAPFIFYHCFTKDVALAFSDTLVQQHLEIGEALEMEPAIAYSGPFIMDTLGWTRVSGCYTARGDERYVLIGNFKSLAETEVKYVEFTYPCSVFLYVEDVSVRAFDPLPDTMVLCAGETLELHASFRDASGIMWNTGQTDTVMVVDAPGVYSVSAIMEDCALHDTVVVLSAEGLPVWRDTAVCRGSGLRLVAPVPGESYEWSDGRRGRAIEVEESGVYEVRVETGCGDLVFGTEVEVRDCGCAVYVPNAISPNGDGVNDELRVEFGCDYAYRVLRFGVYDRWGNELYEQSGGEPLKWDGRYRGQALPSGVYVWMLEYEVEGPWGRRVVRKGGDVAVLR